MHKYNVSDNKSKRTYEGIVFDSEKEMQYYRDIVRPLYDSGEIIRFELQKKYELQPPFKYEGKSVRGIYYVADFFIVYKDLREEIIDVKGYADSVSQIKRKLFFYKFPDLNYKWISYSKIDGGWCDYDYVKEQRKNRKKIKKEVRDIEKNK